MNCEELYESGYLPEKYYNQMNGKTTQENYKRYKLKQQKKNESFILSLVKNMLSATVKGAIDEIFKGFKNQY